MLPRNPAKIFRSRWSALIWAGGVIFFAVTTIGFGDDSHAKKDPQSNTADPVTDVTGSTVSKEDLAVLKNYLDGK